MTDSIGIHRVPTGLATPHNMQAAQEKLLSRFNPEKPPQVAYLQSAIDCANSSILFALDGVHQEDIDWSTIPLEKYVGTLTLVEMITTTRITGYIEHVVVDRRYEGKGIGEQLVRKAIEIGTINGASRFDLTSNATKDRAQKLYKRLGFHTRDTVNWRLDI